MTKSKNKIPKTFVGFLIASFLIWLLITLSKEYNTIIRYPVIYKNIPQDKLLQEDPIKEIDLAVKATGFKLISSQFKHQTIAIEASSLQRNKSSKFYLLPKNQTVSIQKQLLSGVQLQEILKDTIYLNLGILTSKKVPLKSQLSINYHIGYDLLKDIKVEPDSIIISGPKLQIDRINFLNLSKLVLDDVRSDFTEKVAILTPKNSKNLKFKIKEATISGKVEKFTEGTLIIPFTVKNLPEGTKITSLFKSVEVIYVVALSNFAKISEKSFKIECDFDLSKKNNLSYLIPKVLEHPPFIKSYKIVPSKIDFLIQK
ncbi:hypothetical protein MC378_01875 [Polaribacter sp. MSW13]|uniref:YbbR-like domain-containing protein n=1 Tax=Polaribacter marinus TaxID=2916838 RepID=A0A9X1VKM9_9FLAO|nr:hypothetical protein [Polaribacter marinus]MCI2227897.1 hypothetical protein [Polaribacter marinus]